MANFRTWQNWLLKPRNPSLLTMEIYGSIVTSARQSTFYSTWGVPDTREGRFEMLALHVALVMRRLTLIGPTGTALGRAVAEAFVTDLDDNMREIGIGDLAVPRKIKKAGAALFDRYQNYGAALETTDSDALRAALISAFEGSGDIQQLDSSALQGYTEQLWGALRVTSDADCMAGLLPLPYPTPQAAKHYRSG